MPKAKYTF